MIALPHFPRGWDRWYGLLRTCLDAGAASMGRLLLVSNATSVGKWDHLGHGSLGSYKGHNAIEGFEEGFSNPIGEFIAET